MTGLRDVFLSAVGLQPEYRPKFCRTRGCSLKFEHDGNHDGAPTSVFRPFHGKRPARGRVTVQYRPYKSPKALPVEGAAVRMAEYRRRPVKREETA